MALYSYLSTVVFVVTDGILTAPHPYRANAEQPERQMERTLGRAISFKCTDARVKQIYTRRRLSAYC